MRKSLVDREASFLRNLGKRLLDVTDRVEFERLLDDVSHARAKMFLGIKVQELINAPSTAPRRVGELEAVLRSISAQSAYP